MSVRGDTWRAMAAELGARLENHAHRDCGHSARDADCPSCTDYTVWQKWAQREIRALRLDRVRANKATEETTR